MGLEKFGNEPRDIKEKTGLDETELQLLKVLEDKSTELGINVDVFLDKISALKGQL